MGRFQQAGEEGRLGGGMSHTPAPIFFFSPSFFFAVCGGREGHRIMLFSIVSLKKTMNEKVN